MKEVLHHETPIPSQFNRSIPLLGFAAVLVLLFAYGGIMSLLQGHHAWGTTDAVPWGILITAYVYFAVGCTGMCLLSSLAHVFHFKPFETMGVRPIILAIVSMVTAFIIIALELKYVLNLAIYFFISPNFKSVFILMGILYGLYLVLLFFELIFYVWGKHGIARIFAILAIISGVSATTNLGLVFGSLVGRAYWTAPMIPILWISSALATGAAAMIILYYFTDRDQSRENSNHLVNVFRKLLAGFIIVYMGINGFNIFTHYSSADPERYEAANYLLGNVLNFWVLEVGLLVLALLVVLFFAKKQLLVMYAGVVVLIAMMFARDNTVTAGQIVELSPDGHGPITIATYTPTFVEYAMTFGAFGVVIVGYIIFEYIIAFAKKFFKLA